MSRSEALRPARIEVAAPLGTAITVSDGGFATVAQGTTRLGADLPDGVYTLTLSEGEQAQHWTARLRGGAVWRYPEDVPIAVPSGPSHDPMWNARRAWLAELLLNLSGGPATEIVIVVSSPDFDATASLERSIRVSDATHRRRRPERVQVLDGGHTLIRYSVPSGPHRLGFESFERKRMEQAVYAVEGRRTVVLMDYGQASIVERVKEASRIKKRRGVDPARTVIVSLAPDATAEGIADQIRLAGILLYLLRTRVSAADIGIAQALIDGDVDPYLRLYAALAIVVMPGNVLQRLATSIDRDPSGEDLPAEFVARRLHGELHHMRDWPDLTCLGWRLGHETADALDGIPMLEVNWRWASSRSVREGLQQVISPRIAATASRADASASPWLAVGATPSFALDEQGDAVEDLLPELTLVAGKVAEALKANDAMEPGSAPGNESSAFLDAAWLSPSTERLVQSIVQTGGTALWSSGNPGLLPQLAAYLGEPLAALANTIRSASRELRDLLDRAASNPDNLWNTDPHKGQFGGAPDCHGARLELELVTERDDFESLALQLAVTTKRKAAPLSGYVTFFLHPTFSPSVEMVPVIDGVARFAFHAWGAFTIGVETADGRRMELDLAQEAILPEAFRAS